MDTPSLDRVQQDLEVLRAAVPADFPYDRGNIVLSAAAGLCGVPFALRAVPGWDGPMTVVLLAFIVVLMIATGGWFRRARAERGIRPRRWAWGREEVLASGIAILGLIAYAVLTRWNATEAGWNFATWRERLAGPALFGFGIGMAALGAARSERRSFLGWGMAFTALGLAMPWVPSKPAFWVAGGMAVALGGLMTAALLWWQLRQWEGAHDSH